jgi:hypothetical protein
MKSILAVLRHKEEGQDLVEYAMLVGWLRGQQLECGTRTDLIVSARQR